MKPQSKAIVARLDGYGNTDMYLRLEGNIHHWVTSEVFASSLTIKRANHIAAQLNRESTHSTFTVIKAS